MADDRLDNSVVEIKQLLTEIRDLLRRQTHLFEKYDEELFREEEDVREKAQSQQRDRRRR